jgi:hypothetical protein
MSTGSAIVDKARVSSVEYWQNIAKDLSVENEELRKQLGSFQQSKGVAVQEVLTQLFVEKVKDAPALESIIDSPTHGKLEEGLEILRTFLDSGCILFFPCCYITLAYIASSYARLLAPSYVDQVESVIVRIVIVLLAGFYIIQGSCFNNFIGLSFSTNGNHVL